MWGAWCTTAKHRLSLHISLSTLTMCHELPAHEQPQACSGNRYMWVDTVERSRLKLQRVHHKNVRWLVLQSAAGAAPPHTIAFQAQPPACRWATGLTFTLPDTLNHLLVPYFNMGRAQLTDSPFAFVNLAGRPLTKTSMSSCFHSMLSRMDSSFSRIPPSLLRHIFVDEGRSRQRVEGPDDAAAAQVMSNSTQAWSKNHDLHFDVREAQAAVDAMQTWRQHLLPSSSLSLLRHQLRMVQLKCLPLLAVTLNDLHQDTLP